MTRVAPLVFAVVAFGSIRPVALAQQIPDPEFDAKVERPAYTDRHPAVLFDEAHNNFHTTGGRYKPFADLVTNDGYAITSNPKTFSAEVLKGYEVLVIVNAQGAPLMRSPEAANSAFSAAECEAVRDWVRAGGALLLVTDHYPWGTSSESMAARLGVELGKSTTLDPVNSEPGTIGLLIFSRENGLIGDHPILNGRDGSERVDRVLTFTGQSLKGPEGSVALLKLSKTAVDQPRPAVPGRRGSAAGRAQGLAFTLGQGRVVVLGEAAMLSAQINGMSGKSMGMNVPGTDNRQLALNIMHWLSGLKTPVAVAEAPAAKPPVRPEPVAASTKPAAPPAVEAVKPTVVETHAPAATNRREEPGRPLSSAEIAAESEPSIAMITGESSVGTGFLVRPGLIATNAHVIDDDFISSVRVRFPSAEKAQQGPFPAELISFDTRRDLAFLRVKSSLPPLRVTPSYTYRKGEDITVIGNPGAGGELVLENAISRGLMSSKTTLEGQRYYQLGIAVNPGNSGGPVFDTAGRVIGVVTRKSAAQEGLAFAIPAEDLNLALEKVTSLPQDVIDRERSRHRLVLTVKGLGSGGVLYSLARSLHLRTGFGRSTRKGVAGDYDTALAHLEKQTLPKLRAEVASVREDPLVSPEIREKVGQLSENLDKLKTLSMSGTTNVSGGESFTTMKGRHRRLLVELCKSLAIEVPENILDALEDVTQEGSEGSDQPNGDSSKKETERPR